MSFGLGVDGAKSRYSQAYLSAICAQSGSVVYEGRQDEDCWAIDARVELIASDVAVQLKCTEAPNRTKVGIRIDLKDDWIEKWSLKRTPVYVVGVVVPVGQDDWIEHSLDETTVHNTAAYWARFDRTSTAKSITLPYANRFGIHTLDVWNDDVDDAFGEWS